MKDIFTKLRDITIDYTALGPTVTEIEVMDKVMTTEDIARLVGAMSGSTIRVKMEEIHFERAGEICVATATVFIVENSVYLKEPMVRHVIQGESESVVSVVDNINFVLKEDHHKKKIAAQSLAYQMDAAKQLGFTKIIANVVGESGSSYTGWKVWPLMGYDAEIPSYVLSGFPQQELSALGFSVGQPLTIQRLLDAGGQQLWEKHGKGVIMEIDLICLNKRAENLVSEYAKHERETEITR